MGLRIVDLLLVLPELKLALVSFARAAVRGPTTGVTVPNRCS